MWKKPIIVCALACVLLHSAKTDKSAQPFSRRSQTYERRFVFKVVASSKELADLENWADHSCSKVPPPKINNGYVIVEKRWTGNRRYLVAIYSCEENYELKLHGNYINFCYKKKWTGDQPECILKSSEDVNNKNDNEVNYIQNNNEDDFDRNDSDDDYDQSDDEDYYDQKDYEDDSYQKGPTDEVRYSKSCEDDNGGCAHICNEISNECECYDGYTINPDDSSQCDDIDECAKSNGGCMHTCFNYDGDFACTCNDGYIIDESDGTTCLDIDECADKKLSWQCEGGCENLSGSFRCLPSLRGRIPPSDQEAQDGKVLCMPGFKLSVDGSECKDINECELTDKDPNSGLVTHRYCQHKCENTIGSYICHCPEGYHLLRDNQSCASNDLPDPPATKVCLSPGFELSADGSECQDINECELMNPEDPNSPGGYKCSCPKGYRLGSDFKSCEDVDECLENNGGCQQVCRNQPGTYTCACESGYELTNDKKSCQHTNYTFKITSEIVFPRRPYYISDEKSSGPSRETNNEERRIEKPAPLTSQKSSFCPKSKNMYLRKGETQRSVTWKMPRLSGYEITGSHIPGQTFNVGNHTIVYKVTNAKGHTASCTFFINVSRPSRETNNEERRIEKPAPLTSQKSSFCPKSKNMYLRKGETQRSVTWKMPRLSGYEITGSHIPGQTFNVGNHTIVYKVTNAKGHTASCTFFINVSRPSRETNNEERRIEKPAPLTSQKSSFCPKSKNMYLRKGETQRSVTWKMPRLSGYEITGSHIPGQTFNVGNHTIVYKVTNAKGHTATCTFFINVSRPNRETNNVASRIGKPAPLRSQNSEFCPRSMTMPLGKGQTQTSVTWEKPFLSGYEFTGSHIPGQTFDVGNHTIVYKGINAKGHTARCTFFINVKRPSRETNNVASRIGKPAPLTSQNSEFCPRSMTMPLLEGQTQTSVTWEKPFLSGYEFTGSHIPGQTFDVGNHTIVYKGINAKGHTARCTFFINVKTATTQNRRIRNNWKF
ncbi:uncharacterized protein LOC108096223 isoform X4 [Drosophila ficusphila]|uniref:uncharacterized protein LOC108096223 isoform X4 n=1 Tax=Drosophila ficusphila TaxID=30025 RepID=UPI001C8A9EB9|nr:uncharacterized protein LOC108096223 isoform X4 [Drosophila ficusphila]